MGGVRPLLALISSINLDFILNLGFILKQGFIVDFITNNKIPVGEWMETGVDWLTMNGAGFFDAISILLETVILFVVDIFKWMPPAIPIVLTAALAWYLHRSIPLVIFIIGIANHS